MFQTSSIVKKMFSVVMLCGLLLAGAMESRPQSRQQLPCELTMLSVNTNIQRAHFDAFIVFNTIDGDTCQIDWRTSREERRVTFSCNSMLILDLVIMNDDSSNPRVETTRDPRMLEKLPELARQFDAAITAALNDPNLVNTLMLGADNEPTANTDCDNACAAGGAGAGVVAGGLIGGACSGATAGVAAPGCVVGGRLLGKAAGILAGMGCSWLFC
jgi:hypothetical protein